MRWSVPGFYGHAVSIANSRCERMLCWVPSAGFCWYHGLGSGDPATTNQVILLRWQECVSNVAWCIDEPILMFIEFSNNLIIAPGHQILCLLNLNKQTRIACTNNFTHNVSLLWFLNANHATTLAQIQLRIIGELMPAHIVNVGNQAHGKKITW